MSYKVICPKCKNEIEFYLTVEVGVSVLCNKCKNIFVVGKYCLKEVKK
ncbi:MAG TPA: hypothetical protein VMZ91_14650 [Candidatus Paceibacterota bacterium]|nr:hypothetical protein [Candidatus Paceibacterota bacterium]